MTFDLNCRLAKEFKSVITSLRTGCYERQLLRNGLFTDVRHAYNSGANTAQEIKDMIDYFNEITKKNDKYTMFTKRHKVYTFLKEKELEKLG